MSDGDTPMPQLSYQQIAEGDGPSPTVVPNRNMNMIAVAGSLAVTLNAQWVYFGVHAEDARGFAYPDCTPEFVGSMGAALYVATYHVVRLKAPLQNLMKAAICGGNIVMHTPLWLSWSCYDPQRIPEGDGRFLACGKCPTCVERIAAFQMNGYVDPIEYVEPQNWAGCSDTVKVQI
jgi:7-cyano-7-deazaguanine synthase